MELDVIAVGLQIASARVADDPKKTVLVLKWSAWLTTAAAVWATFVAQYDAWREERQAKEKFEEELNKSADIRGDITLQIFSGNPYSDQTRVGSALRFIADCSNYGKAACQMRQAWIWIKPPGGRQKFAALCDLPGSVVEPGRSFTHQDDVLIPMMTDQDLRASEIEVFFFDSLRRSYPNTRTKISNRLPSSSQGAL
jgi:hypothetical protein